MRLGQFLFLIILPFQTLFASDKALDIKMDHEVLQSLPLRAETIATWLWVDVYKAELFAPLDSKANTLLDEQTPLTLQLCYLHKITKQEFIDSALKAIPNDLSPALSGAVTQLHDAYQDVQPDDCYQLSYTPKQGVVLSLNGTPRFQTHVEGFKALYFGIWFGEHPLSNSVKNQLLQPFS